MIFKILPILKFIANSKSVANTISGLIKQFNSYRNIKVENPDLQKVLEVQAEINEKLESQVNLLQDALNNLHKTIRKIVIIAVIALLLSVISIIIVFI